jgi:hypothetical protein
MGADRQERIEAILSSDDPNPVFVLIFIAHLSHEIITGKTGLER